MREAKNRLKKTEKKRSCPQNDDLEEKKSNRYQTSHPTFISPENTPCNEKNQNKKQRQRTPIMLQSPLQVQFAHNRGTIDVHEQIAAVRKELKTMIAMYKEQTLRQVEEEHSHLYEKLTSEIRESEDQLRVLKEANDKINEKAEHKIQNLTELAANEITNIEKERESTLSTSTHLFIKEKQKILQRFYNEVDALC